MTPSSIPHADRCQIYFLCTGRRGRRFATISYYNMLLYIVLYIVVRRHPHIRFTEYIWMCIMYQLDMYGWFKNVFTRAYFADNIIFKPSQRRRRPSATAGDKSSSTPWSYLLTSENYSPVYRVPFGTIDLRMFVTRIIKPVREIRKPSKNNKFQTTTATLVSVYNAVQ